MKNDAWEVRAERLVGDMGAGVDLTILFLRGWSEVALARSAMACQPAKPADFIWEAVLRP